MSRKPPYGFNNPRTAPQSFSKRAIASANWSIADLPGISESDRHTLEQNEIHTTQQLLNQTRTSQKQDALATQLKVHPQHLKKWIALADLSRIPTVGCQYCGLLLHAGIVSPAHLVQMPLPRLHQQIVKLQVAALHRKDECPSLSEVQEWQHQARQLSPF